MSVTIGVSHLGTSRRKIRIGGVNIAVFHGAGLFRVVVQFAKDSHFVRDDTFLVSCHSERRENLSRCEDSWPN